ncbi:MAG: LssY C-terminal domain-containing protein [Planctomycetes bacterium]|nr:LssY C-terminal domain-containing protein [Planctomycetota bacterium]
MTRRTQAAILLAVLLATYLFVAYVALPFAWTRYAHRHPALDAMPGITRTGDDHPGDPINVALIGKEADLKRIMLAAGWHPADPITLRSSLEIAEGTILKRSYDDAPVSSLYLWGRKQDLAFEQPVGDDPRQRHHVRFWRSDSLDDAGRPLWAGSATYDERVGLSHTTGQITHHIAPDVDAERDHLFDDLKKTGDLADVRVDEGFHQVREGRNGGGDPWRTDGSLFVGTIKMGNRP